MMQRSNAAAQTPFQRHLCATHWAASLPPEELLRIEQETHIKRVPAGAAVCKKGEPVDHWVGVVSGLAKMSLFSAEGKLTTLTGLPPGAWFGEGSLLKTGPRLYDILALRDCEIAYLPRATFFRLLDSHLRFNRFLIVQLNERLGQFISLVEGDACSNPMPAWPAVWPTCSIRCSTRDWVPSSTFHRRKSGCWPAYHGSG